jgi:transcriptional regulator with XRE-family HTH domain
MAGKWAYPNMGRAIPIGISVIREVIMSIMQNLGDYIVQFPAVLKAARMRAGLTNEELAKRSGVPYSAICKMQSGERDPKLYDAVAASYCVGLHIDAAFGNASEKDPSAILQQRVHDLELTETTNSGDIARLNQVNEIYLQQLQEAKKRERFYKRWSLLTTVFSAILSGFLIAYLIFDLRSPDKGFIQYGNLTAGVWIIILLVSVSIGGCGIMGYKSLRETAELTKLQK